MNVTTAASKVFRVTYSGAPPCAVIRDEASSN